ncbi:MAG: LTA synthase family protein [Phycisphaerae bacterium]
MSQPQRDRGLARSSRALFRDIFSILSGQRLRPLWITTGLMLGIYLVFRAVLLALVWSELGNVSSRDIVRCVLAGLQYDAVPLGYFAIPLLSLLLVAGNSAFDSKRYRKTVAIYSAGVVTLVFSTELMGVFFFQYFGERFNWIVLGYPLVSPEIAGTVWKHYPVVLVPAVVAGAFYLLYRMLTRWFWKPPKPNNSAWSRSILGAVLGAIALLACHGSLEVRPLQRDSAYFSRNNLINQITLNNFYTFFHAARDRIHDNRDDATQYGFPPAVKAAETACSLLCDADETTLDASGNPLWRRADTARPMRQMNVVIILMEGMAGRPVGAMGHEPSHTPNFDALADEGLLLTRMYSVGDRTSRGITAVLCGHPDISGTTVLKRPRALGHFLTLPGIFSARGYRTMFIYGGDPQFDNMAGFLTAGGVEEIIAREHMQPGELENTWGAHDEVIFRKAHETFRDSDEPFFATILTLTNHPPFTIPSGRIEELPPGEDRRGEVLNAYRYADWALGEFFEMARGADYFDNTLFVLVSDHGRDMDRTRLLDVPGYRVPCLLYAPGLIEPSRIDSVCSQTDIPPTILAWLGGSYEHGFLGRNILSGRDDGVAILRDDERLGMVSGDKALILSPQPRPLLFELSGEEMTPVPPGQYSRHEAKTLEQQALSLHRMAWQLYRTQKYTAPGPSSAARVRSSGQGAED